MTGVILCAVVIYLLVTCMNLKRKLKLLEDTINGEVFTTEYHKVLTGFFENSATFDRLMAPVTAKMLTQVDTKIKSAHKPPTPAASTQADVTETADALP